MARNFAGIPTKPYQGVLYDLPTQTKNTKFGQQKQLPPTTIAAVFNWLVYGASTARPNVGGLIDIPVGGPRQLIDKILSIRIDNLGNPVPVYVYFPDTGFTVVAAPNSEVCENVQTSAFQCFVFAEGFTTGQIGQSVVFLNNFGVVSYVNAEFEQAAALWKASATITRGNNILNQNFGVPALGDQFTQVTVAMQTNGLTSQVFPVLASGFYYITSLVVSVSASQPANGGTVGNGLEIFESTGSAGQFMAREFFLPSSQNNGGTNVTSPNYGNLMIFSSGTVQWKLDATQLWRIRVDASNVGTIAGNMKWDFTYTANPT